MSDEIDILKKAIKEAYQHWCQEPNYPHDYWDGYLDGIAMMISRHRIPSVTVERGKIIERGEVTYEYRPRARRKATK